MYKLDNMMCGNDFNKVLTKSLADGKVLNELNDIEIAFVNNKFPKVLKEKRIYDNVKTNNRWGVLLIWFGLIFISLALISNNYYFFIISGVLIVIGIILLVISIKKIKNESKIK
ncbi:unknown [Firmicutes bacterium CAG:449]|nr:unknown [Firmicutes bacterium CAG:449]